MFDNQIITDLCFAFRLRHQLPIGREHSVLFLSNVFFSEGLNRPAELQPFVIRQVKVRPNLDLELVDQGAIGGNHDLRRIDIGGAQRGDILLVSELLEAGKHDFGFDLVADVLVKAPLDDLAGGLAGPEPRDDGICYQLAVLFVQSAVDRLALDGHLDVLLARTDIAHFDVLAEFFFFCLLITLLGRRIRRRLGDCRRILLLGLGFFSHRKLHQKSRKPRRPGHDGRKVRIAQVFSAQRSG